MTAFEFPTIELGVGFSADPFDVSVVFTDLADGYPGGSLMETLSVTRGRQTENDQAQTGQAVAVLLDDSDLFDNSNTASPFYPNVLPMLPLRARITCDSVTYPVFYGWIDPQDGWVRTESDPGSASVRVPANDGFDALNAGGIYSPGHVGDPDTPGHSFLADTTGNRIAEVLDGMRPAWPSGWRDIDTGREPMQAYTDDGTGTALGLIRDAEETEPGFFFMDGRGYATYRDRANIQTATSQATFCDKANVSAGRVLYTHLTTRRTQLINDVRTTRNGGTLQRAFDAASNSRFLNRFKEFTTQHTTDGNALLFSQWLLHKSKDSYEVVESITLTPGMDLDTWVQVLVRELGDRITIVRTPPGGSVSVSADYWIQRIELTIGPGVSASCTWRLAAAGQYSYWRAGTPGASEAGTTTRAAY